MKSQHAICAICRNLCPCAHGYWLLVVAFSAKLQLSDFSLSYRIHPSIQKANILETTLIPTLKIVFFTNPSNHMAPPSPPAGFCVNVRGLEEPAGGGPQHLGKRGARRRVRRLHQLRPCLPQGLHCSHRHI